LPEVAGGAALLVDPKRPEEIGSALRDLARDPNERTRLAELGRARARMFPWQRAVESTYNVYRKLVQDF